MNIYYLLKNKKPVIELDFNVRAKKHFSQARFVGRYNDWYTFINTAFIWIALWCDSAWLPILFETMIFGGKEDWYVSRCSTREQALVMHEAAVDMVKNDYIK